MGQAGGDARFLSLHGDYQVAITPGEVLLGLNARQEAAKSAHGTAKAKSPKSASSVPDKPMRMKLLGANPRPEVAGEAELPGKINYFIGNDPKQWHSGVPTFARVRLKQVYSGVDLVYYGNQKQLEYDFIVQPGADASKVRLNFEGAKHIKVDDAGNLRLGMGTGEVRWQRPVAYQNINGKRTPVTARYDVKIQPSGEARVGFALANYDHACPLVIDPVLVVHYFNTLVGNGSGVISSNLGAGTVVDSSGNSYSVGSLYYPGFPSQGTNNTTLTYYSGGTTTLNGSNPSGTPNNVNLTHAQSFTDIYVTKLDSTGAMQYLTIIGGNDYDNGYGVAIDGAGNAYISGSAASSNMPVPNGYQTARASATSTNPNVPTRPNGYVAKLNGSGSVVYGSYFGWRTVSAINSIAVDAAGTNIYLAGYTGTGNAGKSAVRNLSNQRIPPLTNGYTTDDNYFENDPNAYGGTVGLVARLQGSGNTYNTLVYATIFEGLGDTSCNGIAADPQNPGTAYVIGNSDTNVFVSHASAGDGPGGPPARTYTTTIPDGYGNGTKTLLLRVDTNQSGNASLVFGTYFGGSTEYNGTTGGVNSEASGMAFLTNGIVWIAGSTNSTNFPTKNAAQSAYAGAPTISSNATLFEMDTTINGTNSLLYSTYLGGSNGNSEGKGVDLDSAGNAYLVGDTAATNFPTLNPVAGGDRNKGGTTGLDAFVARIDPTKTGSATLIYSTYLGTTRDDIAYGVGVDAGANVYVTGTQNFASSVAPSVFFAKLGINTPPVASNQTVTTGQSTGINITLTASDANGDSLTYIVTTNPAHGTLTGTAPNLTYQPNAGFFGTDTFQFKANDGYEDSNIATVTINVVGRPTANSQSVSTNENTAVGITLTGSDPNNPARSLTYTVTTNPAHGTLSGTAPNLTYTPTNGYFGADSFQFTVNNGVSTSLAGTVSITVNQIFAPNASNQSVTTNQDTAVNISLSATDPNTPPRPLTYSIVSNPAHGTLSGIAPAVTYTPNAGYFGPDSFTFKANNGFMDSNIATVSITVVGKPTANNQSVTTSQDTAKAITLTGSDPNTPARSLTYTVVSNPAHGTLSGTAPNLTYTPAAGYFGADSFTFKVNNGSLDSNTATVSITVTQVVQAPTANSQNVTTNQDTPVNVTLTGSDPNNPPRSLTYTVVANPTHGTLSGTAPNLTYTPTAGYFGADSFTFKVNNGVKDSNTATVGITVNQVINAPTANSQSVTTNQDTAVGITLTATDPNSPPRSLTYTVVSMPANGTLSGTAPNLTYTPNAGYSGADSFTFKVNNGVKDSNTATVSITVTPVTPAGPTDVSGIITVTRGAFVYNRATQTYTQVVTLTNTGSTTINGPISLILSGLTNATLTNATGTTSAVMPAGRPYIDLPGSLGPNASATLTLRFTSTGGSIAYSTQVVAGPGAR